MGGSDELEPGALITRALRLERRIGGGGMGSVWLAHHAGLDTNVVVKFIAQAISDNPMSVARFRREAAAAASVKSPHVVQMLDYGVSDHGRPYIVMELLVGRDLGEHLRERRVLPPHEVVQIIRQVCKALQRAHDMGVIHRDIKPENIFLCDHDDDEIFVKLLDFGIAKADDKADSVTTTGAAVGTPHYMSPEQAIGSKTIDHRTDLWSMGVLTYFLCTGRRPFSGETTGALTLAIFNGPIPRPSDANPNLPKALDAWFAKACARDADARFASAKSLANELAEALVGDVARAVIDVDAISYRPDEDSDPRSAATVRLQGLPSSPKHVTTLESAPTTDRSAQDVDEPPLRTTGGLSSGVSAGLAPPTRSRLPVTIGAFVATVAIGLFAYQQLSRPPKLAPAQPANTFDAPAHSVSTPVPIEPPPAPSVALPTPSVSAAPSQSVASHAKPVKTGSPKAPAVPSASTKKPHTDEPDLK